MSLILDAGALIAIDRGDRRVGAMLRVAWEAGLSVRTSATVVGQVWRGGAKQTLLARALMGVAIRDFDDRAARRVGALLGVTGASDVVDAHVVLDATPEDRVLTSDVEDIRRALDGLGVRAEVVRV
jgi:hypothetical protein